MRKLCMLLVSLLLLASAVSAQEEPANVALLDSGVKISWPPPVTEVWGAGDVIGSASVDGMLFHYLEYLQLNDDMSIPANAPWIPATAATSDVVVDGTLATLDTTTVPDGLYALRLVVVTRDMQSYTDMVMPIRVSNERMSAYTERVIEEALAGTGTPAEPTATPTPAVVTEEPPVNAPPRAFPAPGLYAVNVRRCDLVDNNACPIIEALDGRGAEVLANSANRTGWLLLRLPSGMEGWVSPTVITTTADTSGLPFAAPPPPLPPPAQANVILNGIAIAGGSATCNVPFQVQVNVANTGTATAAAGTITLQDVNIRTGDVTATTYGTYPAINPGGNFVVTFPMMISAFYNETHELRATAGASTTRMQYTLGQGGCNPQPTPVPPTQAPPSEIPFSPNQCFIVLTTPWPAFAAPYGELITQLAARAWEARSLRIINGEYWYSINTPELGVLWVTRVRELTQGNCGPSPR